MTFYKAALGVIIVICLISACSNRSNYESDTSYNSLFISDDECKSHDKYRCRASDVDKPKAEDKPDSSIDNSRDYRGGFSRGRD